MLPTIDEALKELEIAGRLNPGPWIKHSMNTGVAARNIAEKVPRQDSDMCLGMAVLVTFGADYVRFAPHLHFLM